MPTFTENLILTENIDLVKNHRHIAFLVPYCKIHEQATGRLAPADLLLTSAGIYQVVGQINLHNECLQMNKSG